MITKMLVAPLILVSLSALLVYTQPHFPCVLMALAKLSL